MVVPQIARWHKRLLVAVACVGVLVVIAPPTVAWGRYHFGHGDPDPGNRSEQLVMAARGAIPSDSTPVPGHPPIVRRWHWLDSCNHRANSAGWLPFETYDFFRTAQSDDATVSEVQQALAHLGWRSRNRSANHFSWSHETGVNHYLGDAQVDLTRTTFGGWAFHIVAYPHGRQGDPIC